MSRAAVPVKLEDQTQQQYMFKRTVWLADSVLSCTSIYLRLANTDHELGNL